MLDQCLRPETPGSGWLCVPQILREQLELIGGGAKSFKINIYQNEKTFIPFEARNDLISNRGHKLFDIFPMVHFLYILEQSISSKCLHKIMMINSLKRRLHYDSSAWTEFQPVFPG